MTALRCTGAWSAAAVVAVGLSLAACSPAAPSISSHAEDWQSSVATVADHAAAGENDAALAELDALQTQTQEARQAGEITAERAALIQQSIDLVRADLQPAPAEPETPATEDPGPEETGTVTSPDEPADETGNNGNGNSGNGNGNGNNGNGNGGGNNGKKDD